MVYQDGERPFCPRRNKKAKQRTGSIEGLFAPEKQRLGHHHSRNREQNFAMNLLMNPEIDFVTLLARPAPANPADVGCEPDADAGNQALQRNHHDPVTVPVGEDIGFLPGTEEEKCCHGWARWKTTSTY